MVSALADQTGQTKAMATKMLEATLGIIMDTLKKGDQVRFAGFGQFSVIDTSARVGRNPKTSEPINIAAGKRVKFKAGKYFRSAVNS